MKLMNIGNKKARSRKSLTSMPSSLSSKKDFKIAPSYLNDLVSVLPDSHYQLRRNNNGILLERPRLRTKKTMGDRAFSIAAMPPSYGTVFLCQ